MELVFTNALLGSHARNDLFLRYEFPHHRLDLYDLLHLRFVQSVSNSSCLVSLSIIADGYHHIISYIGVP